MRNRNTNTQKTIYWHTNSRSIADGFTPGGSAGESTCISAAEIGYGLNDMAGGNVWEGCSDLYRPELQTHCWAAEIRGPMVRGPEPARSRRGGWGGGGRQRLIREILIRRRAYVHRGGSFLVATYGYCASSIAPAARNGRAARIRHCSILGFRCVSVERRCARLAGAASTQLGSRSGTRLCSLMLRTSLYSRWDRQPLQNLQATAHDFFGSVGPEPLNARTPERKGYQCSTER
jgi:hypothetical protein